MIPKVIHYCWFGKKKKPKRVIEYIDKWHKMLPDYEIIEWNESNFNIDEYEYVREAYNNKKYAFVSDVARIIALCTLGGIYLDTDIDIKKSFTELLDNYKVILGFEDSGKRIMTAFIAAEKDNSLLKEFLKLYENEKFVNKDGSFNVYPNTYRLTEFLKDKGLVVNGEKQFLKGDVIIFPEKYFSAMKFSTMTDISDEQTYTVHHFNSSWKPWYVKVRRKIKITILNILPRKGRMKK